MTRHPNRFRPFFVFALLLLLSGLFHGAPAFAGDHRLGLGLHFWKTVDDLAGDGFGGIEDDGLAYVLSYQYLPGGLLRFELDLEYFDDGFGGSTGEAFSPIGYVLIGGSLYAALGIGVTFASSFDDDVSDPFYAARVGFQFSLLPGLRLDVNANYRANAFNELDQADTDAITLGALVRFNL